MSVRALPIATRSTDAELLELDTARGRLWGWSIRESAGTPAVATVIFRAGESAADTDILGVIELAANGSQTVMFGQGIVFSDSLYLDVVAGEIEGCVYLDA